MVHPDPRVVGHERDVVGLAVLHVERVHPPRAAGRRHPVAGQHHGVVPVQVHRVHLAAVVVDVHPDHVALAHHVHRHVRVQVAVDRPPQPGPALHEPGTTADRVVERRSGRSGSKPRSERSSVRQQVQLPTRFRRRRGIARAQDHRGALGHLDPHRPSRPRASTRPRSTRPPPVMVTDWSTTSPGWLHVRAVDGQHPVRGVAPGLDRAVVGVDHPNPDLLARPCRHPIVARNTVDGLRPAVGVRGRDHVAARHLDRAVARPDPESPPITCS